MFEPSVRRLRGARSLAGVVAALFILAGTGCAGRFDRGVMDVSVINDGDNPVSTVKVVHGGDTFTAGPLDPKTKESHRFQIVPNSPIEVEYVDPKGERVKRTYTLRAEPEHGGEYDFRIDRQGTLTPVSRFDVN